MAKFGIALGSGPRGLGFESRHSDHNYQQSLMQRKSLFQGLSLFLHDRFMLQPNKNHTKNETLNLRVSFFVIKSCTGRRLCYFNGSDDVRVLNLYQIRDDMFFHDRVQNLFQFRLLRVQLRVHVIHHGAHL